MKIKSISLRKTLIQLAGMLSAILIVIVIFKVIEPLKLAALVAGSVFLLVSLGVLYSENRWGRGSRSLAFWTAVFFLVAFVIPIFGLRILYWNEDFQNLSVFGVQAQTLHHLSSRFYVLLLGMVVYEGVRPHLPGRVSERKGSVKAPSR